MKYSKASEARSAMATMGSCFCAGQHSLLPAGNNLAVMLVLLHDLYIALLKNGTNLHLSK